jgi:hypothetical protein
MTTTTWSSTLNFGPGTATVLTNGNLTVDRTGGTNWIECLSTTSHTTGQRHIEFTPTNFPFSNNGADAGGQPAITFGVYDNGVSVVSNLIYPGSTTHGIGWVADGSTLQAGGLVMPAMSPGVVHAIEIDWGNSKLWFGTRPYYLQWAPALTFSADSGRIVTIDATTGLNIQRASGSGNWAATKAKPSRSAGLLHLEFTVVSTPSVNLVVGLVNGTFDSVGTLQQPGAITTQGFGYQSSGTTYGCGGLSMPSLAAGDTVAIEVDFTHSKAWMQSSSNGKWNNDVIGNQNPATNTGGFSISTISGALFPCASVFGTGFSTTLNGEGAFVVTPSSGFSAWNFHATAIWWNNDVIGNQNPATNTGGVSISGLTGGTAYIAHAVYRATAGQVTAQFDVGSGFHYTASSGFSDWDSGGLAAPGVQTSISLCG